MKLYNTLTRTVEEFKPQKPPHISFYSCGPTVYDYPHIGNWYTFIRYDLLNRTLKASGYKVDWVMNITDVGHLTSDADEGEDKLEKGAKREGSTAWEVAKKYTTYFTNGIAELNIAPPTHLPKATDHIKEQIALIQKLEHNGHTYVIDDGVYFDTKTFADYGKMARLDLENLREGARVEANAQKRNPTDFALWKFSPKDQKRDMEWESPWGKGFPGWHIECSAMSMKYLGNTLDIHAGGIDHIPVHHTNEIAQSEGASGKPFAKYWVHMNFILVDGKKMAKSAGTFVTLDDVKKKGFDPMAFRLMVLQSHYRTEAHFSWENLEAAQNRLNEIRAWADLRYQPSTESMPEKLDQMFNSMRIKVLQALQDDLNTPEALVALNELISYMMTTPIPGKEGAYTEGTLQFLDDVFGLNLSKRPDITDAEKKLIADRDNARANKDWAASDKLRNQLEAQGIGLRDTDYGSQWYRIKETA